MTVSELIERLQSLPKAYQDTDVVVISDSDARMRVYGMIGVDTWHIDDIEPEFPGEEVELDTPTDEVVTLISDF